MPRVTMLRRASAYPSRWPSVQGEFVEYFGFDQGQVVTVEAPAARGEGAGAVGVSVAVQAPARDRPRSRYLLHGRLGAVGDRYGLDARSLDEARAALASSNRRSTQGRRGR